MKKATFHWSVDPVVAVAKLSAGIRNKALRIALNAGASPVKQAVIESAPVGVGNLAKSTKIKVKNYKKGNSWVAIVGAGAKFKRLKKRGGKVVKKMVAGKKVSVYARPAKYQNLVNRGTKKLQGRHYLEAAFNRSKKQFEQRTKAKLKQVIEELMRQNSK